jgi:uncharacterized RDD family membrane protein YckC
MSVSIQTSQNVRLEYEPASLGDRILATILDNLVRVGWGLLTAALPLSLKINIGTFYVVLVVVIPILLYHFVCEWLLNGQSVGKIAMKTRVVMLDGSQPGIGAYLLRWLLRIVDISLFSGLVAVICVAATGRGQRLGDLAAGTTVVKLARKVSLEEVLYNPLPDNYVVQFPEVRQLSDHDIQVIREVLRRADPATLDHTADKVRQVIGVQTNLWARAFLETVINDYQFLAMQD